MVAVLALVGESLLQPSRQRLALPALRLREALRGLSEFVRVGHLRAGGQREERQKAWINTNLSCSLRRNIVRVRVDAQAQIPARSTFDDTTAFEASSRDVLLVKTHRPYPWNMDACSRRCCACLREGEACQSIAPSFELGFLRQFLVAPLPGNRRRIQYPLQRVAGNAELCAVIGKQVMKSLLAVRDTVFGILLYFSDSPIPDTCQMPEPHVKAACLRGIEPKLELTLDHATPVSGFRCIAEPLRVEHHQR